MRTLKPISKKDIARFITLTSGAAYDYSGDGESGPGLKKQEFKNLGRCILKYIAQEMGLKEGEYDIRWNPGGVACSGDHTLHTERVYLALHDNLGMGWFYYRSCNGLRDFSGGSNQVVRWNSIKNGLEPLIKALKVMQAEGYEDRATGDFVRTKFLVERQAMAAFQS
jgi:hypothetical protein